MKKLKFYFIKTAIYVTCVDLKTSRSFYSALTLLYFFIYFQRPVWFVFILENVPINIKRGNKTSNKAH